MQFYPQHGRGWLRYLGVTVHSCGIGLLLLCMFIASIVNPPALLDRYIHALKVVVAIQCILTLALFASDWRFALYSLGIVLIMFLLLPFATGIKQS